MGIGLTIWGVGCTLAIFLGGGCVDEDEDKEEKLDCVGGFETCGSNFGGLSG